MEKETPKYQHWTSEEMALLAHLMSTAFNAGSNQSEAAAFASSKTIKLAKFGSASIATSITLPAKNSCKEIPFKYDLSGNYSWPYAFTSFSLETKGQDMIGSVIIEAGNDYDEDGKEEMNDY
jgi:hypothetical protein